MERVVVVERGVQPRGAVEARRHVEELRRRCVAVLERGRVEERLERGARSALRECHVDAAAVRARRVQGAADHRNDAAGPGLERDERGVGRVPVLEVGQTLVYNALRLVLQPRVERRLDDQPVAPIQVGANAGELGSRVCDERLPERWPRRR